MGKTKTILVAPLHWGLGHASRCIPIIQHLLDHQYNVLLASDGDALTLLEKEFTQLESISLPSYSIQYSKNKYFFKWKIFYQLLGLKKVIEEENKQIDELIKKGQIHGIISDNRLGVYSNKVPSIFISHQLRLLSGNTTFFSSKLHQHFIKKFDECWVPDIAGDNNLSGQLGHIKKAPFPKKYIGFLQRMKKLDVPILYDYFVLLSGPEPQRTLLEEKVISVFKNKKEKIVVVQGKVNSKQEKRELGNLTIINYMKKEELEHAFNASHVIISRSGYTTLMDLVGLEKKTFFIPTPGQYEQEYLAKRMKELQFAPYCSQKEFSYSQLKDVENYKGIQLKNTAPNYKDLFSHFERK